MLKDNSIQNYFVKMIKKQNEYALKKFVAEKRMKQQEVDADLVRRSLPEMKV